MVRIHGSDWKIADVVDEIRWCREKEGWCRRRWTLRPVLIDKHHSSPYIGQKYDPSKVRLDPIGWTHDHCAVCYWTIHETDNPDEGEGYSFDGKTWVCIECFENLVQGNIDRESS